MNKLTIDYVIIFLTDYEVCKIPQLNFFDKTPI